MPTYEYRCTACGTHFERRQSMSDEPVKTCPECAGTVRRVLFPVGIVFKGSGFYVTDYGRNGKDGNSSASNGSEKTDSSLAKAGSTAAKTESSATEPKVTADKVPAAPKAAETK